MKVLSVHTVNRRDPREREGERELCTQRVGKLMKANEGCVSCYGVEYIVTYWRYNHQRHYHHLDSSYLVCNAPLLFSFGYVELIHSVTQIRYCAADNVFSVCFLFGFLISCSCLLLRVLVLHSAASFVAIFAAHVLCCELFH